MQAEADTFNTVHTLLEQYRAAHPGEVNSGSNATEREAAMLAWITATAIIIFRFNPDLLAERLGPRKGAKAWDTAIMSSLGLTQLVRYIVAGLDQRYGWTGGFPLVAQIAALTVCVLGYALFVWATASNTFFSQIVRR